MFQKNTLYGISLHDKLGKSRRIKYRKVCCSISVYVLIVFNRSFLSFPQKEEIVIIKKIMMYSGLIHYYCLFNHDALFSWNRCYYASDVSSPMSYVLS
jgi:hypothetical protein